MTDEEKALKIVIRNESTITDRLFEEGYMFDDEFDEDMSVSITRKLASCIKEHFQLEDEQYVIRAEVNSTIRSGGVLYFSESEKSWNEVQEIAKRHYGL